MTDKQKHGHENVQAQNNVQAENRSLLNKLAVGAGVALISAPALASETNIDLTSGLAGVAIVTGLLAVGSIKALPTFVGWGIKKALSLLR